MFPPFNSRFPMSQRTIRSLFYQTAVCCHLLSVHSIIMAHCAERQLTWRSEDGKWRMLLVGQNGVNWCGCVCVCVYVGVCVWVCVCECVWVCVWVCVSVGVWLWVCWCVWMCVCGCGDMCVCVCVGVWVCESVGVRVCGWVGGWVCTVNGVFIYRSQKRKWLCALMRKLGKFCLHSSLPNLWN